MISLILAVAASVAPIANDTPAPAPTPAPERKICKVENSSASRLGAKRICRTEAEWKAAQDAVSRDLDRRERQ
ncbi:hypothetical protein OK349_12850 [Sphingomonas sp. BT-65]|uniref:hypothetical protein n=1 Tax=Sphingomonas sp. BT-65 TaxID=2989821 RepID=UPI00223654CE|nr:hypothetical protein [Sphingomonas sp. BT-65]MCW4462599.1 hypothetical protein [Sphingomonas sp. BT-65]